MATLTELCNMVLLDCGAQPLDSAITDSTERARALNTAWPRVRRTVLRLHCWNPPTQEAQLDAHATAPLWGFATKYALPADYLRMLEVDTDEPWRIQGAFLFTDATGDDLGIRYVYDEDDPTTYDSTLLETMVLFLAYRVMNRVAADKGMRDRIEKEMTTFLATAKSIDGQEQSPAEIEDDTFITVRH